eukprot:comp22985_c0_seq1/m.36588 comp22985_c0_seq1/g.36588  ORF comp22985_c0_seq1/g.36588 comp22985_c0_seq1/m.36588 type:complete len:309 (+) comp22985_c0_seq1:1261-2187(+)
MRSPSIGGNCDRKLCGRRARGSRFAQRTQPSLCCAASQRAACIPRNESLFRADRRVSIALPASASQCKPLLSFQPPSMVLAHVPFFLCEATGNGVVCGNGNGGEILTVCEVIDRASGNAICGDPCGRATWIAIDGCGGMIGHDRVLVNAIGNGTANASFCPCPSPHLCHRDRDRAPSLCPCHVTSLCPCPSLCRDPSRDLSCSRDRGPCLCLSLCPYGRGLVLGPSCLFSSRRGLCLCLCPCPCSSAPSPSCSPSPSCRSLCSRPPWACLSSPRQTCCRFALSSRTGLLLVSHPQNENSKTEKAASLP